MPIWFHAEEIKLPIQKKTIYKDWITEVIESNNRVVGEVNYIFCSDEYLLNMNKEHLQHDYYTDIITFNYNKGNTISGDLFISIDRIKENASTHNTALENEIQRVMVHGVLHLLGWNDKTEAEETEMRKQEDIHIALFKR